MTLKLLLFDLDGTLLDTLDDLTAATNAALASFGYQGVTKSTCRSLVGNGARVLMHRAVRIVGSSDSELQNQTTGQAGSSSDAAAGKNQPKTLPVPSDAELVAAFNREYEECWHEETKPYPGIMELLTSLQTSGYRLGIISNKPDLFTKKIAAHFFPTINFDFVTGMKPDRPGKPDPALALEICQKIGVSPQETALIVDSSVDMKTAVAAGMLPIGVLWGFREKAELEANGARHLVASAEELKELLSSKLEDSAPTYRQPRFKPKTLFADYGWILLLSLPFLLRFAWREQQLFVENYITGGIFQVLSRPISWLTSLLPFSISETLLLFAIFFVISGLFRGLAALFRRLRKQSSAEAADQRPAGYYRKRARLAAWGAAILAMMFFLLHGVNYLRLPVSESFGLAVQPRNTSELAAVATALAQEASAVRELCQEDENGVFRLRSGVGFALKATTKGFEAAAAEYPQLRGAKVQPKAVMLSHLWSYTGISGIYVPFLVEANVNVDQSQYLIPDAAAHEVAHTRGYAREDEAGFISFLANIHHPDPDFRYSALANAYVRCSNALYNQDLEAYKEVSQNVSEPMARDLNANYEYWLKFAGPVEKVSTQINNVYLKSNNQTDGVHSYGRMIDLVLAYWEKTAGDFQP